MRADAQPPSVPEAPEKLARFGHCPKCDKSMLTHLPRCPHCNASFRSTKNDAIRASFGPATALIAFLYVQMDWGNFGDSGQLHTLSGLVAAGAALIGLWFTFTGISGLFERKPA